MDTYIILLSSLRSAGDIVAAQLVDEVFNQLRNQVRGRISRYRYAVKMDITEGRSQPAKDLDNYAKPILDAVTQSRLLWDDDNQIDKLIVRRRRDGNSTDSKIKVTVKRLESQHGGVPAHFRALCYEASQPGGNYAHVGYDFARGLAIENPYDLEKEAWQEEITRLITMLESNENENVWNWSREHFPEWIDLVPGPRKYQFLSGVRNAYEEERIGE